MNIEIKELQQQRKRLGITQEEIARKLQCSRVTYLRWENGHQSPHPIFRRQISRILKSLKTK